MFMADCGVIPEPTVEQLADIAVSTAQLARHLLGVPPRVAMLSYSTKGSATHPTIGKVQAATALADRKPSRRCWRRISTANCRWMRPWCRSTSCVRAGPYFAVASPPIRGATISTF